MMACWRRSASWCSSAARCSLSASWSRVAASATWVWYCAETSWKAPRSATSVSSTTTGSAKIRICLIAVSPGRTIRNTATAGSRRCSSDSWNRRTGARSAAITKLCSWAIGIGDAWAGSSPNSANAESVQRTVPAASCSSQPPMLPRRCAWPSSSATRSASPGVRQVKSTPAKNGTTVRSAITGRYRRRSRASAPRSAGR